MEDLFIAVCEDLEVMSWEELYDIAEEAGLTGPALWHWIAGNVASPRAVNLIAVAEALGYEVSWTRS